MTKHKLREHVEYYCGEARASLEISRDIEVTIFILLNSGWRLRGITGSAVGHRSIAPGFKLLTDYVRRVFRLLFHL
ncbi:hypothetical protein LSH36_887g02088 [Paralvinella palmiformis]|uniref:Uncharacterized protein n=1 Tax=Paralvinella palmiformis TaxID=53620 RepID=A0AAD9IYS4_9ANNE|nr:hypothetical protein LSH36_887g02088 [Paralvinella palmiformis]